MASVLLLSSCGDKKTSGETERVSPQDSLVQVIEPLRGKIKGVNAASPDYKEEAVVLLKSCDRYSELYPQDSRTSGYLEDAVNVAEGLGDYQRAAVLLHKLAGGYTEEKQHPEWLYRYGLVLDVNLGRQDEAKKIYESFLQKYPEHHFSNDIQARLKTVDIPLEELVKKWSKENS